MFPRSPRRLCYEGKAPTLDHTFVLPVGFGSLEDTALRMELNGRMVWRYKQKAEGWIVPCKPETPVGPYSGEVEVHPELAGVGRGLGIGNVLHEIWETPEEAVAIHARWCERMRSLGLPEKIIDPDTEEVYKMGGEAYPIVQGKIISDFVKNGSLSAAQYREESSELKKIYVHGNPCPVYPEGKGLFVCAACSATLEDFYYVAKYCIQERHEFSFDFQDGVEKRDRRVVDFCCGTCMAGHQNRRKEEEEDWWLTNKPNSIGAGEIRKKRKKKQAAAAKRLAKEVNASSSSSGV